MAEGSGLYQSFKKVIGMWLTVVVAGYAIAVTVSGGVTNPKHPRNGRELNYIQEGFFVKQQNPDQIFKSATGLAAAGGRASALSRERIKGKVEQRILLHQTLAGGKQAPSPGMSYAVGAEAEAAIATRQDGMTPRVGGAEIKSALYSDGSLEIMSGSELPVGDLFRACLDALHREGWLIGEGYNAEAEGFAWATARKSEWIIQIAILGRAVFPKFPVFAYVKLIRLGDGDDGILDD